MATLELRTIRRADPPFAIDVPAGVEEVEDPNTLLTVRDPSGAGSPLRATITLIAEPLPAPMALEDYVDGSLATQAAMLPEWRLLDRQPATLNERPAVRTLGHYLGSAIPNLGLPHPLAVSLEQWRLVDGDRGWVLSCTCDELAYGAAWEAWAACADTLRVGAAA